MRIVQNPTSKPLPPSLLLLPFASLLPFVFCLLRWYYPSMFLTGLCFAEGGTLAHTPPNHGRVTGRVPRAATLLARSELLVGAGGPYFGSARAYVPSLTFFGCA